MSKRPSFRLRGAVLSLTVLLACYEDGALNEESSACTIYDRSKWVTSGLGGSQVSDPVCPVIASWPAFFQGITINFTASDTSKLYAGAYGYGRVAFYDHAQRLIGYPQVQHASFGFHSIGGTAAEATYYGGYLAAADTAHLSGSDYARVRVYTKSAGNPFDSARAEAFLDYRRYAAAQLSGPTAGYTSENLGFTVDASSEFRHATFEWLVDNVSQGAPSETATSFVKSWTEAGNHTVAVRVVPPESSPTPAPYTLPIGVEILQNPGCGGEGQDPCTVAPRVIVRRGGRLGRPE